MITLFFTPIIFTAIPTQPARLACKVSCKSVIADWLWFLLQKESIFCYGFQHIIFLRIKSFVFELQDYFIKDTAPVFNVPRCSQAKHLECAYKDQKTTDWYRKGSHHNIEYNPTIDYLNCWMTVSGETTKEKHINILLWWIAFNNSTIHAQYAT